MISNFKKFQTVAILNIYKVLDLDILIENSINNVDTKFKLVTLLILKSYYFLNTKCLDRRKTKTYQNQQI